jgi:hypothetical protein
MKPKKPLKIGFTGAKRATGSESWKVQRSK